MTDGPFNALGSGTSLPPSRTRGHHHPEDPEGATGASKLLGLGNHGRSDALDVASESYLPPFLLSLFFFPSTFLEAHFSSLSFSRPKQ